jgi:MtN3 and saliva related transmembrane protein
MISDSTAIEMIGVAAATLTTICWLPQAMHVIRTRDTKAISLSAYAVFGGGLTLWLAYGLLLGKWPLIVANAITLSLVGVILGLKLRLR